MSDAALVADLRRDAASWKFHGADSARITHRLETEAAARIESLTAQLAAAEQRAQEAFDLMAQERDNFVKAGQQIRADTIEECARVCEVMKVYNDPAECATAIRQLAKSERTDRGSS